MKHVEDEKQLLKQILSIIENQFGNKCEVVLHDLTKDYNETIVDIRNGYLTDRQIGGCGSNLGLEVLRGSNVDGDRFNYVTHTSNGRILRSSSIYIKNDEGEVIGSLCINFDITESVHFETYLKQFNHYEFSQDEFFANNVNELLDYFINQGMALIGKSPEAMTKNDKMEMVRFLDKKGAFVITKSSEKICELLNISKFTFYNYLDAVRKNDPMETK